MKTISERTRVNRTFKTAQPLPLLMNSFGIERGGVAAYAPALAWPGSRASQSKARPAARRNPGPEQSRLTGVLPRMERDTAGERIAFGLLALAGLACIAQAFGTMAELAPNWELFNAWVSRLVG